MIVIGYAYSKDWTESYTFFSDGTANVWRYLPDGRSLASVHKLSYDPATMSPLVRQLPDGTIVKPENVK